MMPKVWNKRDKNVPKDAVYVGRPSKWGNPFTVERYGRGTAIQMFAEWIGHHENAGFKLGVDAKLELKGKDLVCWCAPRPCHADILLEIANEQG